MNFIWTLIIGFLVGAVAKFFMPGKDPGGWIVTILLGIAGTFVAPLACTLRALPQRSSYPCSEPCSCS
jgi:uncharacterized membrane protein YeaQ/YmgE (transglycosylase-associated protein family)